MCTRTVVMRALLCTVLLTSVGSSQIDYKLSFDLSNKIWTVEGRIANPNKGELDYWFPRWTAGAYHQADFGRWVEELQASDADGNALAFERPNDCEFRIAAEGVDPVIVRYTARSISKNMVPLNDLEQFVIDVESNRIADGYAFVNPASLFGFVPDTIEEPVTLEVVLPETWRAATVLGRDENGVYQAPSYYRFEDSPLFFSPSHLTLELVAGGKPLLVTVYGKDAAAAEELAAGCKRIVEAAGKLMRGLPYERYHFLMGFLTESMGAGLEHSDSTLILANPEFGEAGLWSIIAHEYFHLWCAERIHTAAIHRPDYTQPLETGTIWVNEGITEYFTQHVLLHAGFLDRQRFLDHFFEQDPMEAFFGGQEDRSWTQVSRDWKKVDSFDDFIGFVVHMYKQGPRTIFALDLAMRRASAGEKGVLDLLHHLMDEYVEKDRGFGEGEMPEILNSVAGADLSEFYKSYIDGPKAPDLKEFLDVIGYSSDDVQATEVEHPTPEQLAAREDFFSIDG